MLSKLQLLIYLVSSSCLLGQSVEVNNIIATDYTTTDDDVLEIKFIDHLPNLPFILAWIDEEGKQYALQFVTTEDKLILNLSGQKGWTGKIGLIGISINNVDAQIRSSKFSDRWRVFMTAHPMTPGSVNFTPSYQLFGTSFRWICLGLMGALWLLFALKNRNIQLSLLLAFVLAWSVYDLRSMKNRWDIMTYLSAQDYEIDILKDLNVFLNSAREIIGKDSWTKEPLSGVLNSYCTYQLADLEYKPPRSDLAKDAAYIITTQPKNRNVAFRHGRYFLINSKEK